MSTPSAGEPAEGATAQFKATGSNQMRTYMAFRRAGGKPPRAAEACCDRKQDSIRGAVRCRWRCGRGDLDIVAVDDAGAPTRLSAVEEQKVIHELDMLADDYAEALGS